MQVSIGRGRQQPMRLIGEDTGFGPPVVLVHGWPISSIVWERQVPALVSAGHRVITFDRRGFGRSSRPATGYDMDTLAEDLQMVIKRLDLKECALVGYGMGCSEIVRLLANSGGDLIRRIVLIGPMQPVVGEGKPGISPQVCEDLREALQLDRFSCLEKFIEECFRVNESTVLTSPALRRAHWVDAISSSPLALLSCVEHWPRDCRDDLSRIGAPSLVLHGGADALVPPSAAGQALADAIGGAILRVIEGAPRGMLWTHAEEVNAALVEFLR